MTNPRDEMLAEAERLAAAQAERIAQAAAQAAGPSGNTTVTSSQHQRPNAAGRKSWRRTYHELLDRFYTLDGALKSSNTQGGVDNRAEWSKLKVELEALERKHKVKERWSLASAEFQEAAIEQKAYEIARQERAASGLAATLAGLQHRLYNRRSMALTKKECTRLGQGCSAAKASLLLALGHVRRWLGNKAELSWVTYSVADVDRVIASLEGEAAALVVDPEEQGGGQVGGIDARGARARVRLPWEGDDVMSWDVREVDDLVQRWLRCEEECTIVERELRDMVVYYTRKLALLRDRKEAIEGHIAIVRRALSDGDQVEGDQQQRGGDGGQEPGQPGGTDPLKLAVVEAFHGRQIFLRQEGFKQAALLGEACAVLVGKIAIIKEEVGRLQRLLDAATAAQEEARALWGGQPTAGDVPGSDDDAASQDASADEEEPIAFGQLFEIGDEPLGEDELAMP
ncbi:hypothetical protein PLESTM_000247400 [Pleodorina starrii]|nr:hypothetical protein PLESTM_000247400 [Pleodorina starrii]